MTVARWRQPDWGFLLVNGRRQADGFITPKNWRFAIFFYYNFKHSKGSQTSGYRSNVLPQDQHEKAFLKFFFLPVYLFITFIYLTWLSLLYILTSIWVLRNPNAGQNMHFQQKNVVNVYFDQQPVLFIFILLLWKYLSSQYRMFLSSTCSIQYIK